MPDSVGDRPPDSVFIAGMQALDRPDSTHIVACRFGADPAVKP